VRADHPSGREEANSWARRDLPVPASPVMTTTRPPPRATSAASADSVRSSSSRSTSTGHRP
jgi:hypothetical protein